LDFLRNHLPGENPLDVRQRMWFQCNGLHILIVVFEDSLLEDQNH